MEKRKNELELQNFEFTNGTFVHEKGKPFEYNWMNELGNTIEKYNNTVHKTIKMTPIEGSKKKNEETIKKIFAEKIKSKGKPKFELGQIVRLWKKKGTFEKGYKARFTKELFKIKAIIFSNPIQYELEDMDNQPIIGKVYQWELIPSQEEGED